YEHTIGKFFRGILKNINRNQFEIFVFVTTTKQDEVTSWIINHSDHFEVLPSTLAEARQQIASHSLDILVYTDIGMDPFTYYLAFSRLAPVQCVLYGHPDTTGIPTIDYYLSGGACESETADSHYTEKLVRLDSNSTYTYYYRPNNRATQKTRADFNLPESLHLYTCAQSLFKIHPEMDAVFDEILARDLEGRLVLFDDVKQRRVELFKNRLQKRMRHYDRVIFLPRMTLPDFLQVLNLSDALLDSFHFCGGNTSFDSFAAESPIVTLPGEFMRGRQTLGLYNRMSFTDLVASDKADYIDKVLRLGTDVEFRKNMRDKLIERVSVIFEDSGVVHALEQFFISTQTRKTMTTTQTESSQVNFDPHVEPWRFLDSGQNNHLTFLSQDYAPRGLIDLLETSPTLAIDIGCFVGATGAYIKQKWADCRVVGIEPVADAVAQARTRVDAVFEGFFEDMPAGEAGVTPGNVDLAVFADVLEHMRHPWAALRHVREWLSPNGAVLVSLPNVRNLNVLKDLVNGSFNYRPAGILDITHIRFFTRLDAIKMFEQTGFSVEKISINFDPSLVHLLETVPKDHKIKVDVGSRMSMHNVDFAEAEELCALQFYFLLRPNKTFNTPKNSRF
ncbi:MAG: methyltransferase domain-containing protein, partial [Methylococcaceae bacterium]